MRGPHRGLRAAVGTALALQLVWGGAAALPALTQKPLYSQGLTAATNLAFLPKATYTLDSSVTGGPGPAQVLRATAAVTVP